MPVPRIFIIIDTTASGYLNAHGICQKIKINIPKNQVSNSTSIIFKGIDCWSVGRMSNGQTELGEYGPRLQPQQSRHQTGMAWAILSAVLYCNVVRRGGPLFFVVVNG